MVLNKKYGFRCNYGFICEVLTLRVASGILPAMFFSSSRFLLRPYDVTTTSNLLFVHSFMQFELKCVCDVIFRSYWSEFFCSFV